MSNNDTYQWVKETTEAREHLETLAESYGRLDDLPFIHAQIRRLYTNSALSPLAALTCVTVWVQFNYDNDSIERLVGGLLDTHEA